MRVKSLSIAFAALSTLGFCSIASAQSSCDTSGFYIGGQAGYGKADYGNEIVNSFNSAPHHSVREDGVAGRVYAGYQFNQYFGVETGYSRFSNNTYKASGETFLGNVGVKATAKTQQWDILGKVGMPFGDSGFRGDIKGGAAYVMTKTDASVSLDGVTLPHHSISKNKWDPAAGASLTYNFNRNVAMDVSYLHAFGSNNSNKSNPNTNLVTVGVSYLFA